MMILKKTLSLVVALVATAAFVACGSSNDDAGGGTTVTGIKVTKTELSFSNDGGEQTISVQSNSQISATSDASWCIVTVGTMTQSLKVTPITVKISPMTTETADRTAHITISAGSETATVNITQKAGDILKVSQTEYEVGAEGGSVTVKLTCNGNYNVTSDAAWLTVGAKGNGEHSFTAAANPAGARTANVTFTLNKETASVVIRQAAGQQGTITAKAADIAKQMYPGWNLGNTMEATGNGLGCETSWQPTKTTQAIIDCVKAAGFKSIRIPCSWDIHSDSNGKIDAAWMARVKEIVDYCISDGLYVVLNDHWDNGWIEVQGFSKSTSSYQAVDEATITSKITRLKDLWTQIATEFKGYDEHLLFAGLNEPFQEYNLFHDKHETLTPILIRYNKAFVEAVRATGGNNDKRTLVVQGPSVNIASSCNYLTADKLPESAGYLMMEVHFYDPGQFCGTYSSKISEGGFAYWGAANHVSGSKNNASWGEESSMKSEFAKLNTAYTSKGYPVIIGEYAGQQRNLSSVSGSDQAKHDASVKLFYQCVNEYATNNGVIAMAWDTNYTAGLNNSDGSSTIIDRATCKVVGNNAMEGIKAGVSAGKWPY